MKTPKKKSLLKEGEFMHDLVGEITEVEDLRNVVCPF
jgi:hypothetical protein